MIKKLLLPIVLFLSFHLHAQNLKNTIWLGTKPPSPNMWFKYDTDTVSYSMSGINGIYTPLGIFTAYNGQFTEHDLTGAASCTAIGQYTYTVYLGQLTFGLVADNCTSRKSTLLNYTWTLVSGSTTTGLAEQVPTAFSAIPQGEGQWQLQTGEQGRLTVSDLNGRLLLEKSLVAGTNALDLGSLTPGIYIAAFTANDHRSALRLVR